MKNTTIKTWNWLGGAGFTLAPIAPVACNNWRAGVLVGPFLTLVALGIYLLCAGIGSVWKDAGIRLPSWGSSAQAQQPAVQQQPAGDTNTTLTEVAKLLASLPPSEMKDNTVMIKGNNSVGEIHGPVVKVYPNAKVVPNKITPGSVKIGGEGTVTNTVPVPVGKSVSFTPPPGVTAEWQDHKDEWHPCVVGQHPNQRAIRFTATNIPPQEFTLLWSDI